MKRRIYIVLAACLVAILLSPASLVQAQDNKSQLYVIWDAVVQPSKAASFAAAARAEVVLYAKYKFPLAWDTYSTFDNHFYFLFAVEDFAGIDRLFDAFNKLEEAAGDEYQELLDMFAGTYEYLQPQIYLLNYELCLISGKPAPESETGNFIGWDIQYVQGGKEREYEKLIKEFQAFCKSKNVAQDWYCYQAVMGAETPVYYWATAAKDAVDFYTQNAQMWDVLGEEGAPYYRKLVSLLRKREMKTGSYRPGLSYKPQKSR
jgi:hypothetical protein